MEVRSRSLNNTTTPSSNGVEVRLVAHRVPPQRLRVARHHHQTKTG